MGISTLYFRRAWNGLFWTHPNVVQGGTQILFVVPRAFGDEALGLINATEILISERDTTVLIPASLGNLTQTGMEVIILHIIGDVLFVLSLT